MEMLTERERKKMSETEPRAPLPPETADLLVGTLFIHSDCLSHSVFGLPCWPIWEAHSRFSVSPPHNTAFSVPSGPTWHQWQMFWTRRHRDMLRSGSRFVPKTENLSVKYMWRFSFIPGHWECLVFYSSVPERCFTFFKNLSRQPISYLYVLHA